jgi:hypothetical protein
MNTRQGEPETFFRAAAYTERIAIYRLFFALIQHEGGLWIIFKKGGMAL